MKLYDPSVTGSLIITGSVGIGTDTSSGKKLTITGDISGSGVVYATSASFGADKTNQWMDGWNGNDEFIALTPQDFNLTNYYSRGDSAGPTAQGSGGSIQVENASANGFCMKIIPKGYEAYKAIVYGDAGDDWRAYSGDITDSSTTTISSATSINSEGTFSSTVTGDGTSYVTIQYNPSATSDDLYGGKIFIRRLT